MLDNSLRVLGWGIGVGLFAAVALGEAPVEKAAAPLKALKPFRTFIHVQNYRVEQNGDAKNPISSVRMEVTLPNQAKDYLPKDGQFWHISNGQTQEVNRFYEIPHALLAGADGFKFSIQMVRKGAEFLPCQFDVVQISQFNRTYVCSTDTNYQSQNEKLPPEQLDKESIQIRVFTDMNSKPSELPAEVVLAK